MFYETQNGISWNVFSAGIDLQLHRIIDTVSFRRSGHKAWACQRNCSRYALRHGGQGSAFTILTSDFACRIFVWLFLERTEHDRDRERHKGNVSGQEFFEKLEDAKEYFDKGE